MGSFLRDADVVVAHLGSIKECELDKAEPYATHLGILGLFRLVAFLEQAGRAPLVVVSEFGEELRGLRDFVCSELSDRFPDIPVFPGDIGHRVKLEGDGRRFDVLPCAESLCNGAAETYYEADGEIRFGCSIHTPTVRPLIRAVPP